MQPQLRTTQPGARLRAAGAKPVVALGRAGAKLAGRSIGRPGERLATITPRVAAVEAKEVHAKPNTSIPAGGDPWEDERWTKLKWTVYRGTAYDLTPYMKMHPGGNWLINLAIGRDCTALFESYHLRPEVAVQRLKRLPVLVDFPVDAVPQSPRPNDSELYNAIRNRVRKELFAGTEGKGAHRTGSEWAAAVILGYAAAAYGLFAWDTNVVTGFLLGLAGAWIGLTVQHCGNHGAMSTNPLVNQAMGFTDDLIGGSSLMWRYHHQVSHHIHCNDEALDEDVFSAFPFLRFDDRLPRMWFHKWQHIYMWFTFPFLQVIFQVGDWKALLENRTQGATLYGVTGEERASVVLGKLLHYAMVFVAPCVLHGPGAMAAGAVAYMVTQSVVLAATFAVSHNVAETKPLTNTDTRDAMAIDYVTRDWGVQQVLTSANWGGVIGNFFTGGLNLQIEHHLFPAISFMHYPAIAKITREECEARGITYAHYPTLPEIVGRFVAYMKEVGAAPERPFKGSSTLVTKF